MGLDTMRDHIGYDNARTNNDNSPISRNGTVPDHPGIRLLLTGIQGFFMDD